VSNNKTVFLVNTPLEITMSSDDNLTGTPPEVRQMAQMFRLNYCQKNPELDMRLNLTFLRSGAKKKEQRFTPKMFFWRTLQIW
jgi:hypothetical protein